MTLLTLFGGGLWVVPVIFATASIIFYIKSKKDKTYDTYLVISAIATILSILLIGFDV